MYFYITEDQFSTTTKKKKIKIAEITPHAFYNFAKILHLNIKVPHIYKMLTICVQLIQKYCIVQNKIKVCKQAASFRQKKNA